MERTSDVQSIPNALDQPSLSPFERMVAIFVRPHRAWDGLHRQVQWWFPLLIVLIVNIGLAVVLHERAVMPMLRDAWSDQVAAGKMQPDAAQRAEDFMSGAIGRVFGIGQQLIVIPVIYLLTALLVWFAVSFILGRKMGYRLALEVACWSGLITIPALIVTGAVAWTRETMRGVHVGFGILLPDSETPSRLNTGLGVVLDSLGPLSIWYLIVLILGAAALSGAPRKSVAWAVGGLYFAMILLFACIGALFTPAA